MHAFIWQRVGKAADNYHSEGGIIAFAATIERAREMIAAACPGPDAYVKGECGALTQPPDFTTHAPEATERLFVFPDAGCC